MWWGEKKHGEYQSNINTADSRVYRCFFSLISCVRTPVQMAVIYFSRGLSRELGGGAWSSQCPLCCADCPPQCLERQAEADLPLHSEMFVRKRGRDISPRRVTCISVSQWKQFSDIPTDLLAVRHLKLMVKF